MTERGGTERGGTERGGTERLPGAAPEVLFAEPGASLWWLITGPLAAAMMLFLEVSSGYGWKPTIPLMFLVLISGFLGLQIKAARLHTSVELTAGYLRQGTETINVSEIVEIYPPTEGSESPLWESSRALGELTGVPRGRFGIGIKLSHDRQAQAWARGHRRLRTALNSVVDESAS